MTRTQCSVPVTFLTGAVAISGLPPLNGFISELLIYLGAFQGVISVGGGSTVAALGVIAGLALIGGLAAACFTKAFGIVFLGEPRSEHAAHAHEAGLAMRLPMILLAGSCVLIGVWAPAVVAAYSHCASVGRSPPANRQNARAESHVRHVIAKSSRSRGAAL